MVAVSGEAVFDRIDETRQLIGELEPILQSLMLNDSAVIDGLAQMLGAMQKMQMRFEERMSQLGADIGDLGLTVRQSLTATAQLAAGDGGFDREDPELSLLEYLLPYLPNPKLLDIGANNGRIASTLVGSGYEVFAFEPYPPTFAALAREAELAGQQLHAFPFAIGAEDGNVELLVATDHSGADKWDTSLFHSTLRHPMLHDLVFGAGEVVPSRSLASLVADGQIPSDAAVLKIDTEGTDLAVLRGAGDLHFAVVLTEFWDIAHPFGREGHGDLAVTVAEMRTRGYHWHIQIFRVDETAQLGYFCNTRTSVSKSWGNVIFFKDFSTFSRAAVWCERYLAAN